MIQLEATAMTPFARGPPCALGGGPRSDARVLRRSVGWRERSYVREPRDRLPLVLGHVHGCRIELMWSQSMAAMDMRLRAWGTRTSPCPPAVVPELTSALRS